MKQFYLFLIFLAAGCWGKEFSSRKLSPVDWREIEYGEIKKGLEDTVSVELSDDQIKKLVDLIHSSENVQVRKTMCKYAIVLKTNKAKLTYKINGKLLGEGDLYTELDDANYFRDIYENGKKRRAVY